MGLIEFVNCQKTFCNLLH